MSPWDFQHLLLAYIVARALIVIAANPDSSQSIIVKPRLSKEFLNSIFGTVSTRPSTLARVHPVIHTCVALHCYVRDGMIVGSERQGYRFVVAGTICIT